MDAGATKVSIEVANECRNIRVADNGSGIHPMILFLLSQSMRRVRYHQARICIMLKQWALEVKRLQV